MASFPESDRGIDECLEVSPASPASRCCIQFHHLATLSAPLTLATAEPAPPRRACSCAQELSCSGHICDKTNVRTDSGFFVISPAGSKGLRLSINKFTPMSPTETFPTLWSEVMFSFSMHSEPFVTITDFRLFFGLSFHPNWKLLLNQEPHTGESSQCIIRALKVWSVPGSLLEMQIFRPHVRPIESETPRVSSAT